jgi:hypothetical protein
MNTKAIVFAGAGASKAVNKDRFPTTVEFFEQLPAEIRGHRLFAHVHKFLSRPDGARIIDIEEVLWELQTLASFARNAVRGEGIVGFSLEGERLAQIVLGAGHTFSHLSSTLICAAPRHRSPCTPANIPKRGYVIWLHYQSEPS